MSSGTLAIGIAAIVAVVVLWQVIRYLLRFLSWVEQSEIARQKAEDEAQRPSPAARAAVAPAVPEGIPADHVAAIAAAVAVCGFRVVHIDDQAFGHAWASEGRWMHQTSHQPTTRGM
jgi:hypothetical protein